MHMPRITRFALGVVGLGWLALMAAALGIAETPTRWCNEAPPEPSGQVALHVGWYVAVSALALSFIPTLVSERLRGPLALAWIALTVALISVVMLARYFAGGGNFCG